MRDIKLLKTVTSFDRGTRSERKLVLRLLKNGIHPQAIFHDIYIKNADETYTQIDVVVTMSVGIVVFEVKDYSGWIFGKGHQKQWTQVLAYGRERYKFYNPIMQNDKHIKNLRRQLDQLNNIPLFSVVVFYGDSAFKDVSYIPDNVFLIKPNYLLDAIEFIRKHNEPAMYSNKLEIINLLKQGVVNGKSREIKEQHIRNIRNYC